MKNIWVGDWLAWWQVDDKELSQEILSYSLGIRNLFYGIKHIKIKVEIIENIVHVE